MRPAALFALAAALGLGLAALPAAAAPPGAGNCPPGLAKKSPACVPPGLAKKGVHIGDRLDRDEVIFIETPGDWGIYRPGSYYRTRGMIVRVDPETMEVLELIRAVANVLD